MPKASDRGCQKSIACEAPGTAQGRACPGCGCYYNVASPSSYNPAATKGAWQAGGVPDGWMKQAIADD